ncbi:MAG: putative 7-carboxy-7-deazaguanine synthase QueE [Oscillospiraceae bacterium]|jgi:7-carboxy-7-deazaguanine synthase|nr:putative 7-carboxy-7-deazaguanine synthase QueE [Oscillospiraceae bacterium]
MNTYKIAEMFSSINGEGTHAGQLAFFVRFTGCNLNCSYCDTKWANVPNAEYTEMTADEIRSEAQKSGISNVTVTGGEPLIQPNIVPLLETLCGDGRYVEIETNGSADVSEVLKIKGERPALTMDYKLPSSGMESFMRTENFALLEAKDTVKFVSGSLADLERALEIIRKYGLIGKCAVYISPVFGKLKPAEIVDFMLANKLNGVNVQLQMHKFIWDPNMRGV